MIKWDFTNSEVSAILYNIVNCQTALRKRLQKLKNVKNAVY